jgi:hypothetical protein
MTLISRAVMLLFQELCVAKVDRRNVKRFTFPYATPSSLRFLGKAKLQGGHDAYFPSHWGINKPVMLSQLTSYPIVLGVGCWKA